MKLAFSTVGCPDWSFAEVIATAKDLGFDGVEIRGIADEIYAPKIDVFSAAKIESTKSKMANTGFEISLLASEACLAVLGEKEQARAEAKEYVDLAQKLGVKFVRVLCTNVPGRDTGDFGLALRSYQKIAEYAKDKGVTPLMETNGMFCDTGLLKEFFERTESENKGILWDIHHPYRYCGESIAKTVSNIGKYVKYVHIKDSVVENASTVYKMLGCGDIPVQQAVDALKKLGYDGYLTLEWVKRWDRSLEDAGVVFSHFIGAAKDYLK